MFGENVNYFNGLFCSTSRCAPDKDETRLSTSDDDSFDHGSINEEGQEDTNDEGIEEVVEYDSVSSSLNPSACGHLNPSSYCDVGRLFYGVFKLWSKLQRKK